MDPLPSPRGPTAPATAPRGDRFGPLIEALGDGVITFGCDGRITAANTEARRLFGLEAADLLGRTLADVAEVLPLGSPGRCLDPELPRHAAEQLTTTTVDWVRVVARHGTAFVARLALAGHPDGDAPGATMLLRDVTGGWQSEQVYRALHRVGRGVAAGEDVFADVARECAEIFHCESFVCRFDRAGAFVLATEGAHEVGDTLPVFDEGPLGQVLATGGPARIDDYTLLPDTSPLRARALERGSSATAAAGIEVNGRVWGAVAVTTTRPEGIRQDTEHRLGNFAELIGLGIANREAQAELEALARTDPLTGFGNHRTFQERLRQELARTERAGGSLSLALLDIDHFKDINDENGHQVGDEVIRRVAGILRGATRAADTICRIGGDEIAWILPDANSREALVAVERAREMIAAASMPDVGRVTISAGVCDLAAAGSSEDLQRFADGALYWAKNHGRDCAVRYSPDVVEVLSDTERADGLARQQALQSIRVLARAVDAKDSSTREHSERVADVAVQIAHVLGWDLPRTAELREAGLVHDVGKISVPDSILFKPSRLSDEEYEVVKQHAAVGAEMVADVLTEKQVAWIRGHHERWDGGGYPDGLVGEEIPVGARVLALADSWDVMTAYRPYSAPKTEEEALEECLRCSGKQFWPEAVQALARLCAAGALMHHGAPQPA